MRADDSSEGGEIRNATGSESSRSVCAFLSLDRQHVKCEEIGEETIRMEQVNTSGNTEEEEEEEKEEEEKNKVEAEIESREDEKEDEGSECSSSLREFLFLERLCEEYEDLEEIKSRIEQENASEKAVPKKVEEEIESREDEGEGEGSEYSSSLREFLIHERLCEEDVEAEKKVEEEEIASREDEDDECSSSLREFLMLERLCEEYEEAKERRRKRREEEELEMGFKKFRADQLSTIEEEEEEEQEEEEEEEGSSVREIGEECEHPDDFHREEGKDAASGDGNHIQGEKLMSFEEFCGETFAVSSTFLEDLMEESRISQRRLEQAHEEFGKSLRLFPPYNEVVGKLAKECKGNEEGDTLSKQKRLRLKRPCKAR